jgi:putative hydrolase of HD superfamily
MSINTGSNRLAQQLGFIAEIDKLKDILRRSLVGGSRRNENSAEHSWHLAIMAITLLEYSSEADIDRLHILRLLLIHDIVEIDAGDTFCYDLVGNESKAEREQKAADRIFNLLPPDQATQLRQLWDEFEAGLTKESRLAQGLDRLQPILQNLRTGGISWQRHSVTKAQVLERNRRVAETMPEVWEIVRQQIELAEEQGFFGE